MYKRKGLIIGIMFTLGSLLCLLIPFLPMLSIIPGAIVVGPFIPGESSKDNVGAFSGGLIFILIITLFLSLNWISKKTFKDKKVSAGQISALMFLFFLIVHPLGFYIYRSAAYGNISDSLMIFSVYNSFPFSSFSFILIGLLIDCAGSMNCIDKQEDIK
jgi:hypothetical protein